MYVTIEDAPAPKMQVITSWWYLNVVLSVAETQRVRHMRISIVFRGVGVSGW